MRVCLSWYFHSLVVAGNSGMNSFLLLWWYKCGATSLTTELLVIDNTAACTCVSLYGCDPLLWYALHSSHQIFNISHYQGFANFFYFACVCVCVAECSKWVRLWHFWSFRGRHWKSENALVILKHFLIQDIPLTYACPTEMQSSFQNSYYTFALLLNFAFCDRFSFPSAIPYLQWAY